MQGHRQEYKWMVFIIVVFFSLNAGADIQCSLSNPESCSCVDISQAPSDTNAVFGDSVTLTCTVDNVIGNEVQWTKGGVALGADPNIPGYPRYAMSDNAENTMAGNYDLIITDVQLEDEDSYQCQVTACDIQSDFAFVTVLVPPYGPVIVGEEPGGEYRVVVDETISIVCEAWDAKPVADVSWFKGNDQITRGVEKQEYPSDSPLQNSSAALTMTPSLAYDNDIYTCIINNDALIAENPSVIPAQKKDVSLIVLVPPSPPIIVDYDPYKGTITVNENAPITVTCTALEGKPTPLITWYRENANITSGVDYEFGQADEYGRQNVSAYLRLIGNVTDDNIRFTCNVINEALQTPQAVSFILQVSTPMSAATIAVIVVGVVFLLVLMIILILIFCKKRREKKLATEPQPEIHSQSAAMPNEVAGTISTNSSSRPSSTTRRVDFDVASFGADDSIREGEENVAYSLPASSEDDPSPSSSSASSSKTDERDIEFADDTTTLPDGDVFSISSSLRRSDRGSPVDFLQEDLEILSIPTTPQDASWRTINSQTPQYIAAARPPTWMSTVV